MEANVSLLDVAELLGVDGMCGFLQVSDLKSLRLCNKGFNTFVLKDIVRTKLTRSFAPFRLNASTRLGALLQSLLYSGETPLDLAAFLEQLERRPENGSIIQERLAVNEIVEKERKQMLEYLQQLKQEERVLQSENLMVRLDALKKKLHALIPCFTSTCDQFSAFVFQDGSLQLERTERREARTESVNSAIPLEESDSEEDLLPQNDIPQGDEQEESWMDRFRMPRLITESVRVKKVGCSRGHVAMLTEDAQLFMMGDNSDGQLGLGSRSSYMSYPYKVRGLENVIDVSCGLYHTCAVTSDGTLLSCGFNYYGALGLPGLPSSDIFRVVSLGDRFDITTRVLRVFCASSSTFAVTCAGHVFAFGRGSSGILGVGSEQDVLAPERLQTLVDQGERIVHVATGYAHTAFLSSRGLVFGCGNNRRGQLGRAPSQVLIPTLFDKLPPISTVQCGDYHTQCTPYDTARTPVQVFGHVN